MGILPGVACLSCHLTGELNFGCGEDWKRSYYPMVCIHCKKVIDVKIQKKKRNISASHVGINWFISVNFRKILNGILRKKRHIYMD